MQEWRLNKLEKALRKHDHKLRVKRSHTGKVQVFRLTKRCEWVSVDNIKVGFLLDSFDYVLSLTDDWSANGNSVEWGVEPVLARLKAIDLWSNENFMEEFLKQDKEVEESKKRDFHNNTEAFLYDFRNQFKKTFNDVNTANMSKTDIRKVNERKRKWE